jgi:hypothetical protein
MSYQQRLASPSINYLCNEFSKSTIAWVHALFRPSSMMLETSFRCSILETGTSSLFYQIISSDYHENVQSHPMHFYDDQAIS